MERADKGTPLAPWLCPECLVIKLPSSPVNLFKLQAGPRPASVLSQQEIHRQIRDTGTKGGGSLISLKNAFLQVLGEMAQLVKGSLCQLEPLSLGSQNLHKKFGIVQAQHWESRDRRVSGLLGIQPRQSVSSRFSERPGLKK